MMNLQQYLENLLNTKGCEAYEEEEEKLWELYNTQTNEEILWCETSRVFVEYCNSKGINLEATTNQGTYYLSLWVWEREEM